jgi:hypothetical protein
MKLELSKEEIGLIIACLAKAPYELVQALITKLASAVQEEQK